ncbi:MAG: excinuclease ABC subunit UvrA [Deferrisomatales bacterium]
MSPSPSPPPSPPLRVVGARQNNLTGFDLELPHDRLTVVTGVSGSGKSSLAFDTVFAEGQWRFLESLPTYARTLMEKASRPQVDALENVRPAIALEQRNEVRSARSTVGTVTELYDLFRLLWAAAGTVHCPECGQPARAWTPQGAAREVVGRCEGQRVSVEVPLDRAPWLPRRGWIADLLSRGFARVRIGERTVRLDAGDLPDPRPEGVHLIHDRVRAEVGRSGRLVQAFEEAFRLGDGVAVARPEGGPPLPFGTRRRCHRCDRDLPEPRPVLFSFNHPLGACPQCTGFGAVLEWDEAKVIPDPQKTLGQGAVEPWQTRSNRWWQEQLEAHAEGEGIPLDVPWAELPAEARRRVWEGTARLEGVQDFFEYLEGKRYKMHVRVFLARYRVPRTCPACRGARLRPEVLGITVGGRSIAEVSRVDLAALARWVDTTGPSLADGARELLWRIEAKIATLLRLGLHYLTMDRPTRTLSGGEAQRAALALQLQNHLSGTLYVLDEPTVGLHPQDVDVLAAVLDELADRGNTVLVVEHDLALIRRAGHVVELGPGGGRRGGQVVYQGAPDALARADTPTGRYLARASAPARRRPPRRGQGHLRLRGCRLHNLRDLEVAFPRGVFTCVTGPSGSGKSSLVIDTLVPVAASLGARGPAEGFALEGGGALAGVRAVDQSPMGKTPRSVPLTYLGAYSAVRQAFAALPAARALGLEARHFSFNVSGGRCERCKGTGYERLEMLFFEDLFVPCEGCGGRRFRPEVLAVRFRGRSIHDVLGLTVEEGLELFGGMEPVERPLRVLEQMGLGYLVLGQPATTLSGGEAQRLKIAAELVGRRPRDVLYVLDEPTTGLHAQDVGRLVDVLHALVDAGNTVVAVEHNLDFIAQADWVIDLGPGGGADGGRIVDAGAPEEIAHRGLGATGRYLRAWLAGSPRADGGSRG